MTDLDKTDARLLLALCARPRATGVELATIDANTKAAEFERDLEISEMYHRLNNRH